MSSAIKEYRKKPLVVRAIQWGSPGWNHWYFEESNLKISWLPEGAPDAAPHVWNPGTGKWLPIDYGDYIILAPTGCRYPVKADQFDRNYEAITRLYNPKAS